MYRPAQSTKTCHASFSLSVSSHHIPLLSINPLQEEGDLARPVQPDPALSPAPSESGNKRARHAARTSLVPTPRMLCVKTHYPSDPSRAKRTSRSVAPTDFGGSLRQPLEIALSTRFSGRQTLQHEFSTHFNALSSATIGSLRVRGCLHFPKGFRFLVFIWLLDTSRLTHFFVVLVQFLTVFPSIPL